MTTPLEKLRAKEWVAKDDSIESIDISVGSFDPYFFEYIWTTETYIAHGQIQLAFEDSDVTVCDIEAKNDRPQIYLEWNGDV